MQDRGFRRLRQALRQLVGRNCWGIVAGAGTGSTVALDYGKKVPRKMAIRNPHLTEEQRCFTGEYSVFVTCSWRLDSSADVICGWEDGNDEGGPMLRGLRSLVGRSVSDVEVMSPGHDLAIRFESDTWLRVFCDHTSEADDGDNYSFFTRKTVYTVGCRGRIRTEPRDL